MVKLSQLNHLVGKINMQEAGQEIWDENPKAFSVMGILLAVRKKQKKTGLKQGGQFNELRRRRQEEGRREVGAGGTPNKQKKQRTYLMYSKKFKEQFVL